MPTREADFRILVATDGSAPARAAIAAVVEFPWLVKTRVRAVIARQTRVHRTRSVLLSALDRSVDDAAAAARAGLGKRWPDVEAVVVDSAPAEGVLREAERFRADMIVAGWRGHGAVRRLLMGSVSRGIVRGARSAVLVVRRGSEPVRRIVIGFDGSPNAARAVELVGRLVAPRDAQVTLVSVVDLLTPASRGPRVGGIRSSVAREVRRINTARRKAAVNALHRAADALERRGWRTRVELKTGEPLRELIAAVSKAEAQLLVVGARGTSGVRHLLLGSVAEGVLNRCPVPVLVGR